MSTEQRDTVFIGKKPIMAYVTATLTQLASLPMVTLTARGKRITQAIDVSQMIVKRMNEVGFTIDNVRISSDSLTSKDGQKRSVSTIEIDVKDIFVFHDDMDIDIGKIKTKIGGGNAGHNGIDSIDKKIGKNYSRIRIGIGRPKENSTGADHVLDNFSIDEKDNVDEVTKI